MQLWKKANRNNEEIFGTSLMGYVTATYEELVNVFGREHFGQSGDGKVNAEWCLEFADGTIATIYDWKESSIPLLEYKWHIGGNSKIAVALVKLAIEKGRA